MCETEMEHPRVPIPNASYRVSTRRPVGKSEARSTISSQDLLYLAKPNLAYITVTERERTEAYVNVFDDREM